MKAVIAAAFATALVAVVPAAQAQSVNRVVAVARPSHYQGVCPARFEFTGTIFVNMPTHVTYRWERSDGGVGPVQSATIRGGGLGVNTFWQVGGNPGRLFNGSETLHLLSPVDMYSNPADISAVCH